MSHVHNEWAMRAPVQTSGQRLVLIVLADYANRETGACWPSIASIAEVAMMTEDGVSRILRQLADLGLIEVRKRFSADRRQLSNLYVLPTVTSMTTEIIVPENGGDPSQESGRPETGAVGDSGSPKPVIKEPVKIPPISPKGDNPADSKPPRVRKKSEAISLADYIAGCDASDSDYIPETCTVFDYRETIGLPMDFLKLSWLVFRDRYEGSPSKKQASWPMTFCNAVKGNWFKLWYQGDGGWTLTTAGKQAQVQFKNRQGE